MKTTERDPFEEHIAALVVQAVDQTLPKDAAEIGLREEQVRAVAERVRVMTKDLLQGAGLKLSGPAALEQLMKELILDVLATKLPTYLGRPARTQAETAARKTKEKELTVQMQSMGRIRRWLAEIKRRSMEDTSFKPATRPYTRSLFDGSHPDVTGPLDSAARLWAFADEQKEVRLKVTRQAPAPQRLVAADPVQDGGDHGNGDGAGNALLQRKKQPQGVAEPS